MTLDRQARELREVESGLWSPEAVQQIASYLRPNASDSARVISGAVIWEYEAELRPFMNQPHPLAYLAGIPPDYQDRMEAELRDRPPEFIVLDGYTERIYLRHSATLEDILSTNYVEELSLGGTSYRVAVNRLRGSSRT